MKSSPSMNMAQEFRLAIVVVSDTLSSLDFEVLFIMIVQFFFLCKLFLLSTRLDFMKRLLS